MSTHNAGLIALPLPWYGRPSREAVELHRRVHAPGYWLVMRPEREQLISEAPLLLGAFDAELCFPFQGAHSSEDWRDWEDMADWRFRPLDSDGQPVIARQDRRALRQIEHTAQICLEQLRREAPR